MAAALFGRFSFAIAIAAASIAVSACSGGGSSTAAVVVGQSPAAATPTVLLGAWSNPAGSGGSAPPPAQVIAQTALLESAMHRNLALHLHYLYWRDMKSLATNPEILDDVKHRRIPVISWHCPDDVASPALDLRQIAASDSAAQDIAAIGRQLAALRSADGSPYPVMLRWFWEFNLNTQGGSNADANANGGCFTGADSTRYPAQYISAWQKIATTFAGLRPHPNVSMVWNPVVVDGINGAGPYGAYYPAGYVDWIGFDGYNKENPANGDAPLGFAAIFSGDLSAVVGNGSQYGGKPIMIGETGSCNEYAAGANTQAAFLAQAQSTLRSGAAPWSSVKAFIYYDAPGVYRLPDGSGCTWSLDTGLPQWMRISADPYFQAAPALP